MQQKWLFVITPKTKLIDFNFKEVWAYRDLLILFVKRDVITVYKQTILGPLWYLIQPLFTSVIFTLVFNTVEEDVLFAGFIDSVSSFQFFILNDECSRQFFGQECFHRTKFCVFICCTFSLLYFCRCQFLNGLLILIVTL